MTGDDPQWALRQLVDALRLVALPADEQVAALPPFVHVPDEIVLYYDDAFQRLPGVLEVGVLREDQAEPLRALDELFAEMTDAPDKAWVWTLPAVENDQRWARTRTLAVAALTAVGAVPDQPQFASTVWMGYGADGKGVEWPGGEIVGTKSAWRSFTGFIRRHL